MYRDEYLDGYWKVVKTFKVGKRLYYELKNIHNDQIMHLSASYVTKVRKHQISMAKIVYNDLRRKKKHGKTKLLQENKKSST